MKKMRIGRPFTHFSSRYLRNSPVVCCFIQIHTCSVALLFQTRPKKTAAQLVSPSLCSAVQCRNHSRLDPHTHTQRWLPTHSVFRPTTSLETLAKYFVFLPKTPQIWPV